MLIRRYGVKAVEDGGLRVRTTLDPRLQLLATQAIQGVLRQPTDPASALVAIDPRSGAVRALTAYTPGGGTLQFNLATQGHRQAGSAFKPFVLTAGLEDGFALRLRLLRTARADAPGSALLDERRALERAQLRGRVRQGYMSLRDALAHSVNTVFAQLVDEVGPRQGRDARARDGDPLEARAGLLDHARLAVGEPARDDRRPTRRSRAGGSTTRRSRSPRCAAPAAGRS